MTTRILVVDNYDSFVFNLVRYLAQLGAECDRAAQRRGRARRGRAGFDGVLLSPGPGTPEDAGVCVDMVAGLRRRGAAGARRLPGPPGDRRWRTARSSTGRPSCCTARPAWSSTTAQGVLAGLPSPFTATRYHSLAVEPDDRARRARGHRHGPRAASSWRCGTASCRSRACSSTPSRCSPRAATGCSPTGSEAAATTEAVGALGGPGPARPPLKPLSGTASTTTTTEPAGLG